MAEILDLVNGKGKGPVYVQPLFITCDPARDDPKSLQTYLAGSPTHPTQPLTFRISSGYHWVDGDL